MNSGKIPPLLVPHLAPHSGSDGEHSEVTGWLSPEQPPPCFFPGASASFFLLQGRTHPSLHPYLGLGGPKGRGRGRRGAGPEQGGSSEHPYCFLWVTTPASKAPPPLRQEALWT